MLTFRSERQAKKAAYNRAHNIDPSKPKVSIDTENKEIILTAH